MAISRAAKATLVKDIAEKWQRASSVLFAHYIGLSVANISRLRQKLKTEDAEMKVAKKTLLRRAAESLRSPFPEEKELAGPVACIFNYTDPLAGARVAFAFGKEHPQVRLVGAVFEGNVVTGAAAVALAQIPPRHILLSTFVGLCSAPLQQFATTCASPLRAFALALQERAKQLPRS